MLALTGAGRLEAARGYLASLKELAGSGDNEVSSVTRTITVPLCEGLMACGDGRYDAAADILYGLRDDLTPMGASHAQRDVFQQIMIDAVIRAGRDSLARELLEERDAYRPGSDWARVRLKTLS